jgi:hypothetical protein
MGRREERGAGLAKALALLAAVWVAVRLLGRLWRRLTRQPPVDPEALRAGHETSDISALGVVGFFAAVGFMIVLVLFGASVLLNAQTGLPPRVGPAPGGLSNVPSGPTPPAPQLEVSPGQQLADVRQAEEQQLSGYGWVDRGRGVVRIPIDRAIDLIAERGLPARPPAEAAQFRDHGTTSPSGASSGRVEEVTTP